MTEDVVIRALDKGDNAAIMCGTCRGAVAELSAFERWCAANDDVVGTQACRRRTRKHSASSSQIGGEPAVYFPPHAQLMLD